MSEWHHDPGRRAWAKDDIDWGIWDVGEEEIHALGPLEWYRGKDVIELGCGTAYFSAWFAKLGARPVGLDVTPAQLEHARKFQREFGIEFPLIEASAEDVPLPDSTFDVAFSEYGASIWCDPYRWIPEAARLLRPGGKLIFLRNSTIAMLCTPEEGTAGPTLLRDYAALGRLEWSDDGSVEFQIPHGEMVRLLRRCGFRIEDLIEIVAPDDGRSTGYGYMNLDWAKRWPSEEVWVATRE